MKKILIVSAHPDDEVLGCGATIAKLAKKEEVFCLFLGKGKSSRGGSFQREQEKIVNEAEKAKEVLGMEGIFFKDFPDQKYDTVSLLEIIKSIEELKKKIEPDLLFTHSREDLNLDHNITLKAVLTAFRPLPGEKETTILGFEVLGSSNWSERPFSPNVFYDVSDCFDKKIKALEAYESEKRKFPHPRSIESITSQAKYWGSLSGKKMAEAFELLRTTSF